MTLYPKNCYERNFSLNENTNTLCQSNKKDVEENFKLYERILSEIVNRHPQIYIFDPINIFCSNDFCNSKMNNQVLYFDDSHIIQFGSDVIADYMKIYFK